MDYNKYKEYRDYYEDLIEKKDLKELKDSVSELNVVDIAEIIEDMDDQNMLLVFRMLPKEISAEVFSYMEMYNQLRIVNSITEPELKLILDKMNFDDRIDIIEEMPANVVTKVLAQAPSNERKLINEFLRYPEDSAGSIMTIEYMVLKPDMTVSQALDHIKKTGMNKETVYTCYVEDAYKKLIGFVSLRKLVISPPDILIKNIMEDEVISVNTTDDQELVADKFVKYGFIALPVVDTEHKLCGIITFDDVLDVVREEATEDFHKMAAISPSENEYKDESAWQLAKNRIPWLLVLMISATLTSGIIDNYNYIIAKYIILTTFIPMITDTGGNSGSQSSTVIIRALATDEIGLSDAAAVLFKEFRVGLICGGVLSLVNFLRLLLISKASVTISLLVSITLFITVTLAKLMGALLPIAAKKINLDPAIMASALITTIIDSVVLIIYFGLASRILPMV
ncbi:magnesium transporter [Peptoniphilus catoniae]|uniref:magnesium transporter n=1 Tax=Peptoniphilus catoniae TaxID=1660341 RepID=UPI0010FD664E|nr:magnesium transporter [Peptoniphilus catoniae]